jgi:hypothetical protein
MADSQKVLEIIRAMGERIEREKDYLTELDQPIGDSTTASTWRAALPRWSRSSPRRRPTSAPFSSPSA